MLRADDDPRAFAALLDALGVTYELDVDPVPIFYRLSRRVAVEEVAGFRGGNAGGRERPATSPNPSLARAPRVLHAVQTESSSLGSAK